jgi:hypothetical protein
MISVGGPLIEILDKRGRLVARHAQEKKGGNKMTIDYSLTDADIHVARALGIELNAVARLKYASGASGMAGKFAGTFKADADDNDAVAIGVVFPDKTTNRTRRDEVK